MVSVAPQLVAVAIVLAAIEYTFSVMLMSFSFGSKMTAFGLKGGWLHSAGVEMSENALVSVIMIGMVFGFGFLMQTISGVVYPGGYQAAYSGLQSWLSSQSALIQGILDALDGFVWALRAIQSAIPAPGIAPLEPASVVFSSYVGPWINFLQLGYVTLSVVGKMADIMNSSWAVFVGFGALIYALPLKVGRSVGSTLIAVPMTLYLGLPLMPAFVNFFAANSAPPNGTVCGVLGGSASGSSCVFGIILLSLSGWQLLMHSLEPIFTYYSWIMFFLPLFYVGLLLLIAAGGTQLLGGAVEKMLPLVGG